MSRPTWPSRPNRHKTSLAGTRPSLSPLRGWVVLAATVTHGLRRWAAFFRSFGAGVRISELDDLARIRNSHEFNGSRSFQRTISGISEFPIWSRHGRFVTCITACSGVRPREWESVWTACSARDARCTRGPAPAAAAKQRKNAAHGAKPWVIAPK